jgi:hypothetical protein
MFLILVRLAISFSPGAIPGGGEAVAKINGVLYRRQGFMSETLFRLDIPEAPIGAVMGAESRGLIMRNGSLITSRVGAMGLMQAMPGTSEELWRAHAPGSDPHDARASADRCGAPDPFATGNAGRRNTTSLHGTAALCGPDNYLPHDHCADGSRLTVETVLGIGNGAVFQLANHRRCSI